MEVAEEKATISLDFNRNQKSFNPTCNLRASRFLKPAISLSLKEPK